MAWGYAFVESFMAPLLYLILGVTVAFSLVATIVVIVVVLIYMAVNVACILYYLKRQWDDNPVMHGVVPVVGILAFVPAWLTAAGIPAFDFIGELPPPLSHSGPVGIWTLMGIAYLMHLYARDPQPIRKTGRAFLEGDAEQAGPRP